MYFYPLLYGFQQLLKTHEAREPTSVSTFDLQGQLLAHVLRALSSFVEATGQNVLGPKMSKMCRALFECCWQHRNHELPIVRRQVVYGLSRVVLFLPTSETTYLSVKWMDMQQHLHQVHQRDVDHGCREAAAILLHSGAFVTSVCQ